MRGEALAPSVRRPVRVLYEMGREQSPHRPDSPRGPAPGDPLPSGQRPSHNDDGGQRRKGMTSVPVAAPRRRLSRTDVIGPGDAYGHARLPARAHDLDVRRIEHLEYGRFRNVYLYITERCQLRCKHCYMGDRLDRGLKMPWEEIVKTLTTWREMGGSKLTILGGEPTLHPDFIDVIRVAHRLGYEHVITTTNGL